MNKTITLTEDELEAAVTQIGARIGAFEQMQKEAGKNSNIPRVLEIEKYLVSLRSVQQKLWNA